MKLFLHGLFFTLCCSTITLICVPVQAESKTIARCGAGWLEKIDGLHVLHLKGTPYEMGYQHGALMKEDVKAMFYSLLVKRGEQEIDVNGIKIKPRYIVRKVSKLQRKYVPKKYYEEMQGLAAGSGLSMEDVITANFIPELFHCSGFAIMNSATKNGELYHGRVLDYAVDWQLQEHAVVIVAEPKGGIPFVNVSYSGFIGSVTGMNSSHVSIGEMGGRGLGHWEGVPMSFLVREVLEKAKTLEDAIAIFRDNKRTCEYYYVIADGKTNQAVGMEASWNKFMTVKPNHAVTKLPIAIKDAVVLSSGDRYKELTKRVQAGHGTFTEKTAIHLMDCPVAMKSNLHNVLMAPKSTKFWVANASKDKKPAAYQKYHPFQLSKLLKKKPEGNIIVIPFVRKSAKIAIKKTTVAP